MFADAAGGAVPGAQRRGGARQEADADGQTRRPARPLQPQSAILDNWLLVLDSLWKLPTTASVHCIRQPPVRGL